jgi:large conductance mechanosensitive channel
MLKGFKDFIMRGNLVELAVAFIIGTAFALVVSTFTAVILSLISKVVGDGVNFDEWEPGKVPVGTFVTALISFLIVAAVVYFFVVVPYNKLQERMSRGEEAAPPAPDIALLTEIRDLLAGRAGSTTVEGGGGLS